MTAETVRLGMQCWHRWFQLCRAFIAVDDWLVFSTPGPLSCKIIVKNNTVTTPSDWFVLWKIYSEGAAAVQSCRVVFFSLFFSPTHIWNPSWGCRISASGDFGNAAISLNTENNFEGWHDFRGIHLLHLPLSGNNDESVDDKQMLLTSISYAKP